tara:strand:- start:895 stop:4173 length:3279 start_codon:yes stop_codon:yes gene_type:complete
MGLLGKSFRDFVSEQVEVRQKALGEHTSRFSTGDNTKAFLNNTPWIRLASSVDIYPKPNPTGSALYSESDGVYERLSKLELFPNMEEVKGSGLAKKFVLFGGTTSLSEKEIVVRKPNSVDPKGLKGIITSPTFYSGLNNSNSSQPFGGAYGFGSWDQIFSKDGEGYKPMPGITSMDFSYKNDGALSQASVTVKAFSRSQFQIIDVLFQRPGYTVLLEYGHSVFIDNKTKKTQYAGEGDYTFNTAPFTELFNDRNNTKKVSHYSLASSIYSEKKKWSGNYEGAFMKITKYNWKYNSDGSYDITINLVGTGDIISSLKTNVVPIDRQKSDDDIKENKKEKVKDGNYLEGNSNSSAINKELHRIWKSMKNDLPSWLYYTPLGTALGAFTYYKNNISENTEVSDGVVEKFPFPIIEIDDEGNKSIIDFELKTLKIPYAILLIENTDNDLNRGGYDDFCYITFGYLISLLTKYVNLKDNKNVPYIFYDFNFQQSKEDENLVELIEDKNYLATYAGNMSSSPSEILIPFKKLDNTLLKELSDPLKEKYDALLGEENEIRDVLNDFNKDFYTSDDEDEGSENRGRLDRVYLDVNYIAKVLNDNTSVNNKKKGECNLIDVLKQILEGINNSLGGINNFRVIFNQETQLISFISETPATSDYKSENLSTINTLGLKPFEKEYKGSFVKEIDLKAELNDDFATQISIGAQSNGNRLQGNGGAFSLYNKGLKDRIIPEKIDSQVDKDKNNNKNGEEKVEEISLIDSILTEDFIEALEAVYRDYNFKTEYIDILKQFTTSLSPMATGELAKIAKYPTPFFLPFNLGLTLHGLGGVKIYDGFKVDGKMLPPSYDPDSISLIIKSLSHTVNLDGWVTKIETLPKPIFIEDTTSKSDTKNSNNNGVKVWDFKKFITSSVPTSENSIPLMLQPINPTDPTRFNAIKKSFDGVFLKHGEKAGMCSRWSYNLALNYCRALKSNPSIPGKQVVAGGNAKQNLQYFRNLVKLGYIQTKVGTNISKNRCISLVKNTQWGYGDVIVYYANEGDSDGTHVMYGHTQIYVGSLSPSNWATSKKTNYGGGFIYKSRNSNKWDFYIFRAPENASQVIL